ncbi:MAG TPA: hypothetical protein VFH48_11935 [Chloroflexota bacterium]|nr:hypothetical protein [Chloroflexota bacterium]
MVGRATSLVLYVGWPCALALVVALVGLHLGKDGIPTGRRLSTTAYGKFEALSVCVQSVTGERRDAEAGSVLLTASLAGLGLPGPRLFTVPAAVDVGCPREAAHFGVNVKTRRVANRSGSTRPEPSPYHLHVFLMPRTTLQMMRLEPDLRDRQVMIEEYIVEGVDDSAAMTGVTYGLYATLDELADGAELRGFFEHAVRTQSRLGAPPRARP